MTPTIVLSYEERSSAGVFTRGAGVSDNIWIRMKQYAQDAESAPRISSHRLELTWPAALNVLRESSSLQHKHNFIFDVDESSAERIQRFMEQFASVSSVSGSIALQMPETDILTRLEAAGWQMDSHQLKDYQLTNLRHLLSLANGANFSVPGAGKTTEIGRAHV